MDQDKILDAFAADNGYRTTSLDTPVGGDDSPITLEGVIGQEGDDYEEVVNKIWVEEHLASLNPSEQLVLRAQAGLLDHDYDEQYTQAELAEMLGVSQMQVSRITTLALQKLSDMLDEDEITY